MEIKEVNKTGLVEALKVSTSKNGKYRLTKADEENGFYFEVEDIKVPLKSIFNMNDKIWGIMGIGFGTAKDCPSKALGLCQLPSESLCYARAGEKRATRKNNEDGSHGMDSYWLGVLSSYYWDLFAVDGETRLKFIEFCETKDIELIRFNLKGDFRSETDIICIYYLAEAGFSLTGYTARDDLAKYCETLGNHPNVILNGSNRFYTNYFKATTSLEEYRDQAEHSCLGSCLNCGNCYRLRGEIITVLVHGNGSDTYLNTKENREYILSLLEDIGVNGSEEDFTHGKGLTTGINYIFREIDPNFKGFKDIKEALAFIDNPFFMLETSDIEGKAYTVADNLGGGFGLIKARTLAECEELARMHRIDLNMCIYPIIQ